MFNIQKREIIFSVAKKRRNITVSAPLVRGWGAWGPAWSCQLVTWRAHYCSVVPIFITSTVAYLEFEGGGCWKDSVHMEVHAKFLTTPLS